MRSAFSGSTFGSFVTRQITAIGSFFRRMPAWASSAASGVASVFRRLGSTIGSMVASIRSSLSRIGSTPGGGSGGGAGGGVAGAATGLTSMLGILPQMALYATAIVNLTGLIGNLLPLMQLVAPAAIAAGAGLVVFKMATSGIGDALKAGIDGDVEKLAEALKKLSPSARSAVLTMLDLRNEWKRTQKAVQESFWKGARDDLIRMSRAIQPVADRWLPKLATAFANVRTMLANVLTTSANTGQLDKIMAGVHRFFEGLLSTIPFLVRAFLDIAEVAAPSLGELGEGIGGAAKKFSDWIRTLKEDGTLQRWLEKAKETFGQVMGVFEEVGRIIKAIFDGGKENTDDFLTNLKNSLSDLAGWLESDDGQATLRFIGDIGSALANVITWIAAVVGWFRSAWDWVAEKTEGLRDKMSAAFGAVAAAVGYVSGVISGMGASFGWIEGVIGRLGNLANMISNVTSAFSGMSRLTGGGGFRASLSSAGKGILNGFASGGHPRGLGVAGEHGAEIIDFGNTGRVFNAGQSQRMLAGGGGSTAVAIEFGKPDPGAHLANATLTEIRAGRLPLFVTVDGRKYQVKPT